MDQQQAILDNLRTGIIALDRNLRVTSLNAAGEAILETSEPRCLGRHASELVREPAQWLTNLEQALADNAPHASRSITLVLPSGQETSADVVITPTPDEGPEMCLLVELLPIDRLLKISREESLMHSHETTRAVIRGLAHEIKNPLGGVRGAAQLLARELPDDSLAEYTSIIIREADRLRDLVDRLLGPRRKLEFSPLNIHEVMEQVRELITAESGNTLRVIRDYDPSLPDMPGDRGELVQAVLNITRNAVQAAADPADCEIVLRTRSQRQFTIGSIRHRLVCRIDITDNGPGIGPELLPTIFAPMVTSRAHGTGLGLSITQSIIARHGGTVTCTSEPGNTCFTIYLPMDKEHAESA